MALPPGAATWSALAELGRGERPLGDDAGEDGIDIVAPLAGEFRDPRPHAFEALGARHAPAQQRLLLDGEERGLMRPIFEQPASAAAIGLGIEMRALIRPEP